ncbi:MAG: YdeI/OmpD-associated family protein [Pseudomonadota bacterium]
MRDEPELQSIIASMDGLDRLEITSAAALWDWLAEHHGRADGVLLVTWKAAHRNRYVSREAILDALIAHGWIDGRRFKLDADRTMQLISLRRQQVWARSYKDRAERLEAEGRMHPAGRQSVAEAKRSGLWEGLPKVEALQIPTDLAERLAQGGAAWFDSAAPSYRRNVLRWLASAKTPPTRAKRIGIIADHAAEGCKVPNY